ncbi:MAG: non-ribosomal peptide synthetase, partial [Bacillota bacterium]|nr:non-ribosomal peptide synthetase [Bacillota bacterium]
AMVDEIMLKLNYNGSIYDEQYIKMISKHIENLLKEVTENPEKKISEMDMLSEEEKKKILVEFNNTKADYPKDKTIYELFEEQVEKSPENIALVYEDKKLSYRELNNKANQLARVLREKGVGPDKIVGIMVERSLEMIVGIVSILKAGGAYLPIDPEYPKERIEYMLEDSKADILLTQTQLVGKIMFSGSIIEIDKEDVYVGDSSNLDKINEPSDLAYVIYTSGTTGKPKGVMIEHFSAIRVVKETNYIDILENDTILQLSNYAFDGSIFDIFGAILNGAELVVISKENTTNMIELMKIIKNKGISVLFITTALFNVLSDTKPEVFKNLRKILFGGQMVSCKHVRKVMKSLEEDKLIHVYGPTESTVYATYYCISKAKNTVISIGKPISNTRVYIVDKNNKLQPTGIPGELCISGDGLARGYLNRPELNEEKFIANPYEPGERMYKTGDWARWLPDGNIEFIGRIDNQVKIRGFRIELGEIEIQLLKHEEIKEAVVIDREDKEGNKYLCAYVVSNKEITVTELRNHLSKELPDYMVPAHFMELQNMPLTPNGKIDRKALPEPGGDINTGVEYIAPRNEIEEKIAKVWSEVLGVETIGIDDNFFALGGHSLKAIQVVSM